MPKPPKCSSSRKSREKHGDDDGAGGHQHRGVPLLKREVIVQCSCSRRRSLEYSGLVEEEDEWTSHSNGGERVARFT
ncbi:hypothetical protein DBV15_01728 [Temnothorax longispinosus]|uniref:Uncharacterized protein n=1 Tax=Temnothorax longispinosus TaxID=300112 RepID=A0A4S2KS41_9HYME|nr:hypothetical protein DBV15_01728 [Temnothorax longispinosus]